MLWMWLIPAVAGCGNGVVERGEVCDDGGRTCAVGVEYCLKCISCARRVVASRYTDGAFESPSTPSCTTKSKNLDLRSTYDSQGNQLTYDTSSISIVSTYGPDGTLKKKVETDKKTGEITMSSTVRPVKPGVSEHTTVYQGETSRTVETRTATERTSVNHQGDKVTTTYRWGYDDQGRTIFRQQEGQEGIQKTVRNTFDDHGQLTRTTEKGPDYDVEHLYTHTYAKGELRRTVASEYGGQHRYTIDYDAKRWPDGS